MSYLVTLTPSNHQFSVDPNETILDAALRQDISLPYGCQSGACGACLCILTTGEVSYPSGKTTALEGEAENACLACQGVPKSDLELHIEEIKTDDLIEVQNLPCKIIEKTLLCHDVIKIVLKLPDEKSLVFRAGQYLNFILDDQRKRAFSIANAPHNDDFIELHIRHVDGGSFTDKAFNELKEKDIMRIEAPLGQFTFDSDSPNPVIMVAGGTGFAPLKAMIEHAIHIGQTKPIILYCGVRAQRDLYMQETLENWQKDYPNIQCISVLSEPDDDWKGRTGFVHQAVVADYPNLSIFDIYMAGPPVMCQSAKKAFLEAGLNTDKLYSDPFEFADD